MVDHHGDNVVRADADKCVRRKRGFDGCALFSRFAERREIATDDQATAGERGCFQESTAREIDDARHCAPPLELVLLVFKRPAFIWAARWIALRIRWYVPQRQM